MVGRKLRQEQIKSVFQLVGPMGEMLEIMQQVVLSHHPAGVDAGNCPICLAFQGDIVPILDRWADVRAKVEEHWDV